ncbi:MAG TPA: hypothetical protein VII81_01285, partial [Terriglobales bacterium]
VQGAGGSGETKSKTGYTVESPWVGMANFGPVRELQYQFQKRRNTGVAHPISVQHTPTDD